MSDKEILAAVELFCRGDIHQWRIEIPDGASQALREALTAGLGACLDCESRAVPDQHKDSARAWLLGFDAVRAEIVRRTARRRAAETKTANATKRKPFQPWDWNDILPSQVAQYRRVTIRR